MGNLTTAKKFNSLTLSDLADSVIFYEVHRTLKHYERMQAEVEELYELASGSNLVTSELILRMIKPYVNGGEA